MPTVGWFFLSYVADLPLHLEKVMKRQWGSRRDTRFFSIALISASTKFMTQMRFELLSFYPILTKFGDITDRLTKNLSEKFQAYPIIKHYVTAQNDVFCFIFITISTPISTKFFGQF